MTSLSPNESLWTFAIVSVALFMVVLDNLVVTTALPSIRDDIGRRAAGPSSGTVNAVHA
jgi:hypothetical protein